MVPVVPPTIKFIFKKSLPVGRQVHCARLFLSRLHLWLAQKDICSKLWGFSDHKMYSQKNFIPLDNFLRSVTYGRRKTKPLGYWGWGFFDHKIYDRKICAPLIHFSLTCAYGYKKRKSSIIYGKLAFTYGYPERRFAVSLMGK